MVRSVRGPWQVSGAVVGERVATQRGAQGWGSRVVGVTGRNRAGVSVLGEDPWPVRENDGSSRISEVRDCHVPVLSLLLCCDPLWQAAPE